MLRAGVEYRIGAVKHIFPRVTLQGSYTYTSKHERQHVLLLTLLQDFASTADECDLNYTITGGTLLGALRHDGFVPWDTEASVDLPIEQAPLLVAAYLKKTQYILKPTAQGYRLTRAQTTAPYLDLFLTEYDHLQQKYQYTNVVRRERYSNYRNTYDDIHPRRCYVFEDITLWGPCQGLLLCQRLYGENCLQSALVGGFLQRLLKT